jgi:uroporphyrinogen III methyltransferase/synthase
MLERAQVVVYDRLLDPSLLNVAPTSAERIFVGKERGRQALNQTEINQLLVERARNGLAVVRLKGGDPFVFGRGGEEALALTQNGIPFEVVPGVSSPVAAAAYAGIPVTHRGIATSVTVATGSEDPSKAEFSASWESLGEYQARTGGTLVVLMGWAGMESIMQALARGGVPPNTPAALVQWGTWSRQQTVTGCLDNIVQRGQEAGVGPPVIAVIGGVVELREQLAWFDQRPLFGKKVLITRSRAQASRFRELLEELGAQPFEIPAIQTASLEDYTELDGALARLGEFHWVIFASVNAVGSVFERLETQGRDSRAFGGVKVGAIGPATGEALSRRGITPDFVPSRSVSEVVLTELEGLDWAGAPVLLPTADIGRDALAQGLSARGARVERIAAYRTIPAEGMGERARKALEQKVDFVTFTSSSTVRNLLDMLDGDRQALEGSKIACIGPTTAATAEELGLCVDLVATVHTVQGLVDALIQHVCANA